MASITFPLIKLAKKLKVFGSRVHPWVPTRSFPLIKLAKKLKVDKEYDGSLVNWICRFH